MSISTIILIVLICVYIASVCMCTNGKLGWRSVHLKNEYFLIIACIFLFVLAAFRGDFTNDYRLYFYCFEQNADLSLQQLLSSRDWLFWLGTRAVYDITNNYLFCYVFVALLMMSFYYKCFKDNSEFYFLSLLLFVAVDNYVISFNLSRNILAASMCAMALKYIWEEKPKYYFVLILVASLIHKSALIMLPMYWILKIDYRKSKNLLILLCALVASAVILQYTSQIANFVQAFIGMNYDSYSEYGLDFGNIGSALKTSVFLLIVLIQWKKIDFSHMKDRVLFNACVCTWYLQILAAKMLMIQRIGYYFSCSFLIFIPMLILRNKNAKTRALFTIGIVLFCLVYCTFIQNNTEFYFFWQNEYIHL